MVRLSLNSNLTPTILNRFAASYNRFRNENGALPSFTGKDWAGKLGIQNTSANFFPGFTFTGNEYQGGTIPPFGVDLRDDYKSGSYIYQDDLT